MLKLDKLSSKSRATLVGVLILTAYLLIFSEATDSNLLVLVFDALSGLSVIGIAVLLYPLFKTHKPSAQLYLGLKYLEGILMIAAGILFFAGNEGARATIYDNIHIIPFVLGAALLYYLIFQTRLVPRFIAVWGFVAVGFLTLVTTLGWLGITGTILDVTLVLMITNEVFLAIWLMTKGFDTRVMAQ